MEDNTTPLTYLPKYSVKQTTSEIPLSDKLQWDIPKIPTWTCLEQRSFQVTAARVTAATSLDSFKRQLKTFLFTLSITTINCVPCTNSTFASATLTFTF